MRQTLAAALIAFAVSACDATDIPLIGPCSASKRVTADKTYSELALTMATRKAWPFSNASSVRSEENRTERLAGLEALRENWPPTIADECLRAHVDEWLEVKERSIRNAHIGYSSDYDYERRKAEKEDRERALADRLGVRP